MSTGDTLPTAGGYAGQSWQQTPGSLVNAIHFMIKQVIAGKAFAGIVQVKSVTGGGIGTPPIVSVQPLVNQTDGLGNSVPHGTIYNIPVFRLQGGNGAVVLDPAVGDIGLAVMSDRDISTVKATRAVSNPGSFRKNSWADGLYLGGFLNATPTQYVEIGATGINLVTPNQLTFSASNATLDASGNLKVTGDLVANSGADQISVANHEHSAVETGPDTSGPPVPGT